MKPRTRVSDWRGDAAYAGIVAPDSWGAREQMSPSRRSLTLVSGDRRVAELTRPILCRNWAAARKHGPPQAVTRGI